MIQNQYDIIIIGAGVAGTTCALALQRAGYQVLLVDRQTSIEKYKKLCTHFIQPFAVPILHRLGLQPLLSERHSIKTKAAFLVPGGVIDPPGGYGSDDQEQSAFAYNLERRVLDPWLRQQAVEAGVRVSMATALSDLDISADGYQVRLNVQGNPVSVRCRLLIAADGRESRLAKLLSAPQRRFVNERMAFFCYAKGIAVPAQQRSLFSLRDQEMSFLYPLIDDRTLLSVYIQKDRAADWALAENEFATLVALFQLHMPQLDFSQATPDSPMFGYKKYDNQIRPAVTQGVPFIGDASVSIDPMSGVGCGFALQAGDLLARAIIEQGIDNPAECERTLAQFTNQHQAFFSAHIDGIVADSRVSKNDQSMLDSYRVILNDDQLQRTYLDLTGRLISPGTFQRAYLKAIARQRSQSVSAQEA